MHACRAYGQPQQQQYGGLLRVACYYIVMAWRTWIVMAYVVMAYVIMAYVVMAYIVMAI